MNVFAFTRIKLTIWYVSAIMLVSIAFSVVIYAGVTKNIEDVFFRAESRMKNSPALTRQMTKEIFERQNLNPSELGSNENNILESFFQEEINNSKQRVFHNLLVANLLILLLTSVASYILASKTLQPIEEILLEQKRFIADASHELRTPLTSLKTSIEVSLRSKLINKKSRQILKDNLEDVDSLQNLIDSLLQLASQENKTVVKQLVDVQEILSRVLKTVKPLVQEKNIKIVTKLSHQQILASEADLIQLFTILIDNAIKFSNPKSKIRIEIVRRRKSLCIIFSDSGIGISKKYLPHIFDRFYRIDSSRTVSSRQRQGFGLGLAVAKQIVENHSGTINVSSELCKGTTFTINFPI